MVRLTAGDPVPWFYARATTNPTYAFETAAGRYIVLCFFGSAGRPEIAAMVARLWRRRDVFQDDHACVFGVSADPEDESRGRVTHSIPGFRLFWDHDMRISTLYGVAAQEPGTDKIRYRPTSFVIDPNLRVLHVLPITDPGTHADKLADLVAGLFRVDDAQVMAQFAPVVVVPRVLEPEFCRQLIDLYDRHGGQDSGFMRADIATGKTIGTIDYGTKRRRDYVISDQEVRAALRNRLNRRLVPEIQKVFQYKATRIERYMVACYDAGEGGYFRAHRDNTTKGTAHRRFAVTINLNAEEYEGGDLRFPEYGPRTYRAPTGGAVVFSCSMLHEATPIVAGRRYCTLPFLYDDEGAKVRRENASSIVEVQRGETPGGGPAADGPAEPTTAPA